MKSYAYDFGLREMNTGQVGLPHNFAHHPSSRPSFYELHQLDRTCVVPSRLHTERVIICSKMSEVLQGWDFVVHLDRDNTYVTSRYLFPIY
jgi:hypothetical protein